MKKIICLTLSMCLLLACFTAVAFGADSKLAEGGFYMKSVPSGVHVKLQSLNSAMAYNGDTTTVQIGQGKYARVFDGAVKCTITFDNALADDQYIVLMYTGTEVTPTSSNVIKYINQYGNGDSFVVYPADIETTQPIDITILITSQATGFPKTIKMGYAPKGTTVCAFNLGDVVVSDNALIDITDALAILRYLASIDTIEESSNQYKAADTNSSSVVDITDALNILRLLASIDDFIKIQ